MTKKDQAAVFEEVIVTCRLNDSLKKVMVVEPREYFGLLKDDPQTFGENVAGYTATLLTWIDSTKIVSKEKFYEALKEPFLVKINSRQYTKHISIDSSCIELEITE